MRLANDSGVSIGYVVAILTWRELRNVGDGAKVKSIWFNVDRGCQQTRSVASGRSRDFLVLSNILGRDFQGFDPKPDPWASSCFDLPPPPSG